MSLKDSLIGVLILVVMEYGLPAKQTTITLQNGACLNPCFNGIWSASVDDGLNDSLFES